MKKLLKIIGRIIRRIGSFLDKWLITPITKFILMIVGLFEGKEATVDKFVSKRSSLILISSSSKKESLSFMCWNF